MTNVSPSQAEWTQKFTGVNVSASGAAPSGTADAPGGVILPADDAPGQMTDQEKSDADAAKNFQKALKAKKWDDAADALMFLSDNARKDALAKLPAKVISQLHKAAVAKSKDSPVAKDTDAAQDDNNNDAGLNKNIAAKDWDKAAEQLNFYSDAGLQQRLAKLPPETITALHKAAAKANPSSPAAIATEVLAHPVIGTQQQGRAAELEKKLSPDDQKKYQDVLKAAAPAEKPYLTKCLAANHSVKEIEDFAAKIKSKDKKWIQDNLSMTGDSTGSGVKQQWHTSCGPTTYEAVLGELDPIYALKMHEQNPDLTKAEDSDATKMNKGMAEDQRKVLTDGGGVAQNRDQGGKGMWNTDNLNKVSATTGLKYKNKTIGSGLSVEDGIKALNDATSKGRPVPMIIGDGNTGQGGHAYGHYVLVTASDPGPPRYYKIHDPWEGKTVTRSEDQIRKGQIGIAGWDKFGGIEEPEEAK
jgi:hypothetical protein